MNDETVVGGIVSGGAIVSSGVVRDGDNYIPNDLDWNWDLEGLLSPDFQFGIENDFVANDPSDNPAPLGIGGCYGLPDDYVKLCFNGIRQHSQQDAPSLYKDLTFEFDQAVDFTRAGFPTWTSEPAVSIRYFEENGLTLISSNLDALSSDVTTDRVWLYHNSIQIDDVMVFYENIDGDITYAGKIRDIYHDFLKIKRELDQGNFQSTMDFTLTEYPSINTLGLVFVIQGYNVYEELNTKWKLTPAGKFISLGQLQSWEEADELSWADGTMSLNIGTKDEDHRSKYGIIVRDPKSYGASDKVVFFLPRYQVKALISIYGPSGEYDNDLVPLGRPIGSEEFGFVIDHTDLIDMRSGIISYGGQSSRFRDEVHLVSGGPTIETSLTSAEDDYTSNIFVEARRDSIQYYFNFLDGFDLTVANPENPIILDFLRNRLLIQRIDDDSQLLLGYCGDGICDMGENFQSCSLDCRQGSGGSPLRVKTLST